MIRSLHLSCCAFVGVAWLVSACSGGSTSLVVDVRSDFVAGVEAVEVDVVVETLPGGTETRRTLNAGDDLIRGVRAAEIGPVSPGAHVIRATLKGRGGEELLSRRVAVEAHGVTGVVIALTRNCSGVTCPAVGGDPTATECQDGLCVPPACSGDACHSAACTVDTECAVPASVCAQARCVEGVCLTASRIGACDAGFVCVEGSGCVALGAPDAGTPDAAVDSGPCGECAPGEVDSQSCGVCGTRTRRCASDCSWGSYSACSDDDARCTGAAGECINDYCWGYRSVSQSALSCIDMGRDYEPASTSLGTLGQDLFGRPGATWTKENQQTSCAGLSYADAESGTFDVAGMGMKRFPYGSSGCDLSTLGHWRTRYRIQDTDGSTFWLGDVSETTFRNSSCSSDRSGCSAASSFCPPPACSGACSAGDMQTSNCGVCGTHTRSCNTDCTWGAYSSCTDDDARCTAPAGECLNDYCWGIRLAGQSVLSCLDMNRDYQPASPTLGSLGQDIIGRPGASWTKENQETSCVGSSYADAGTGTIPASGTDSPRFSYGASPCDLTTLGHWRSRYRIQDTDGRTFHLATTTELTFYNATCSSDRSSCSAAASLCL